MFAKKKIYCKGAVIPYWIWELGKKFVDEKGVQNVPHTPIRVLSIDLSWHFYPIAIGSIQHDILLLLEQKPVCSIDEEHTHTHTGTHASTNIHVKLFTRRFANLVSLWYSILNIISFPIRWDILNRTFRFFRWFFLVIFQEQKLTRTQYTQWESTVQCVQSTLRISNIGVNVYFFNRSRIFIQSTLCKICLPKIYSLAFIVYNGIHSTGGTCRR